MRKLAVQQGKKNLGTTRQNMPQIVHPGAQGRSRYRDPAPDAIAVSEGDAIALRYVLDVLWRWRKTIGTTTLATLALTAAFLFLSPPKYTAQSLLMVQTDAGRLLAPGGAVIDTGRDSTYIESQVELLRSPLLIQRVLASEAQSQPSAAPGNRPPTSVPIVEIEKFLSKLTLQRRDQTYLIEVNFTDRDPKRAAAVVNSLVDSYLATSLEARIASAQDAAIRIEHRAAEAHDSAIKAQYELRRYRAEHNIAEPMQSQTPDVTTTERPGRVEAIRASVLAAEARLQQSETYGANEQELIAFGSPLRSETLTGLRSRFAELQKKIGERTASGGGDRQEINAARAELNAVGNKIDDEISRLVDVEGDRVTGELAELERREKTATELHSALQAQLKQTHLIESAEGAHIRVVASAEPPQLPSGPRKRIVLPLALLGGLALGIGLALLRESLRADLSTPADARRVLGVPALTVLPSVPLAHTDVPETPETAIESDTLVSDAAVSQDKPGGPTVGPAWQSIRDKVVDAYKNGIDHLPRDGSADRDEQRDIQSASHPLKLIEPTSPAAATYIDGMFALKQAVDAITRGTAACILAVVSPRTGEGKSLTALNLAAITASAGTRTLLVDCNLRDAELTAALAPAAEITLLNAVADGLDLTDVVTTAPGGFDFCAGDCAEQATLIETLGSKRFGVFLRDASKVYDLVIVDTPGLLDHPDARSILGEADAALFVINAQRTVRDDARAALNLVLSAKTGDVLFALTECVEDVGERAA